MEPISLGIAAVGAVVSMFGAAQANEANQAAIQAQMQAEKTREKAMELDAERRRRQQIRQGIIAHSQALAASTNQGSSQSSALQGAFGQIAGQTSFAVAGINSAEKTGQDLFRENMALLQAKSQLADAQEIQAIGSGLMSLGGMGIQNAGTIGNIFKSSGTLGGGFGAGFGGSE